MNKSTVRYILDYAPLVILIISAIILIWTTSTTEISLQSRHIAGLLLLPINFAILSYRHKIGVLALCMTLLLGFFSFISFNPAISTYTIWFGSSSIRIFYGQPIFLLWLFVHFLVSGRHYKGILTKKYWIALINDEEVTFD